MSPRAFLGTMLATAVLALGAAASFNALVDPYTVFDRPRVAGFNAVKPAVENRERLMKAYQAMRAAPRTVIVGSSRVGIGLDPESAAWPPAMQPVYNLGLVGSGLGTSLRYLELMAANRGPGRPMPQTLVIGLDFEAFLQYGPGKAVNLRRADATRAGAVDEVQQRLRLLSDGGSRWRGPVLLDHVYALVTVDALVDSVVTVMASRAAQPGFDLRPSGWMTEGRLHQVTASDGVGTLFEQKIGETLQQYRQPRLLLGQIADGPIGEMAQVQALIRFGGQHRMRLILAVQPSHVARLELLDHMGYWADYERWKLALVMAVDQSGAAPGAISLWDFGGYEQPVREEIPYGAARKRPLQWFWDPVHYRKALGDLMIDTMLSGTTQRPDFGAAMTPASVAQRLQAVRQGRDEFRRLQPEAVDELLRRYCATLPPATAVAPRRSAAGRDCPT